MVKLVCSETKEFFNSDEHRWISNTGALLDISFIPKFDIKKIHSRSKNLWRYREAIPIEHNKNIVSVDEGFTPLIKIKFDKKDVWIKQDQLFSSGSYKDRGASVLMSKAKELGVKKVVQDSSGNAGCAIAMYAALSNIECDIYVPFETGEKKLAQITSYGAKIHKIPGTREDTAEATFKAAKKNYYASHCWNPFFFHGTKTFAYEVCEQLNWKAPDALVLPVGNGTLVIGCYIGFTELLNAGIISKIPKIIAVQSENCAPLFHAFNNGLNDIQSIKTSKTIAEGIAIAKPIRSKQILVYVKASKGEFLTVNETEIFEALKSCGNIGHYIEPTSAAVIAGLRKYIPMSENEVIVSLFSGHGLKH